MAIAARPLPSAFVAVLRPFQVFFRLEAASAILLFGAALIALGWANSPWAHLYRAAFAFPLALSIGGTALHFTVGELVNDGLMALFFFVVGMEIKRELTLGELSSVPRAMLPAIAAAGGMAMPAIIYLLATRGTGSDHGWGIPTATDIAFSLGCLTLLKGRIPNGLVVFLTALAIFDDIGGILVIAIFYGHGIDPDWLAAAGVVTMALVLANRFFVRSGVVYAALGVLLWLALHEAGIHATIAGVVLGLAIPARPARPGREILSELHRYTGALVAKPGDEELANEELLQIEEKIEELEPPLYRFIHLWHPWVAFGVVPLFALANSGVGFQSSELVLAHPVTLGVGLGLFLGKQLGIFSFTWAAVKLGLAPMPGNASAAQLYGIAMVAGIGFTVALFVASLAFPDAPGVLDQAKIGILLGSLTSGVVGYGLLRMVRPRALEPVR